jgi:SAM-dependent methyltransferase
MAAGELTVAQETADPSYMAGAYFDYQKRYAATMRESDKALLTLMKDALGKAGERGGRLLDIGCSSGNLLRHLRKAAAGLEYWGGDIQPDVIERCRAEPDLKDIRFEIMNVRELAMWPRFDIITANAVLFRFPEADFAAICSSLAAALAPGGQLFTFDFYHPFHQDLGVVEISAWHPDGLTLYLRSFRTARRVLSAQGFSDIQFYPFEIPINLPKPDDPSDITTYTRRDESGNRLQFRGCLFQPWCHMIAHKA